MCIVGIQENEIYYSYTHASPSLDSSTPLNHLHRKLLPEELPEGDGVLSKFLDALMELVERHLLLEECPAELRLVVDERNLWDRLALRSC